MLRHLAAAVTRCNVVSPADARRTFAADPANAIRLDDSSGQPYAYVISVEAFERINQMSTLLRLRGQ